MTCYARTNSVVHCLYELTHKGWENTNLLAFIRGKELL